jgi:NADH:ubiquinone reductase (H+-translocating)
MSGGSHMQRIIVLGAGFAGLWAAIGAARARDKAGLDPERIEILVLDHSLHHSIRVRNYEADLTGTRIELKTVLDPIDVRHRQADVTHVDFAARTVDYLADGTPQSTGYDRLICALGSQLVRPAIPGLAAHGFDVDTYVAAKRLDDHIAALPARQKSDGQYTVLVVGAGLTGIEAAAEMPARLRAAIANDPAPGIRPTPRVILADRGPLIGAGMGGARPVIGTALEALGVETLAGVSLSAVDEDGGTLTTGQRIPAATVVWCAGMTAHPLAAQFPVQHDGLGRLPVDHFLRIEAVPAAFAAGDIATLTVDDGHQSVMSCQHSRPMGRFAGHNAVCDLLGEPMLALQIPWYTTILDLGAWGAVYTEGWDRHVVATGAEAKRVKEAINQQRIYPPVSGDRQAILDAAAPIVQAPPPRST